jgi:hypothetical protein
MTISPSPKRPLTPKQRAAQWAKANPAQTVVVTVVHYIMAGGVYRHNSLGKGGGYFGTPRLRQSTYQVSGGKVVGEASGPAQVILDVRRPAPLALTEAEVAALPPAQLFSFADQKPPAAPCPCPQCHAGPFPVKSGRVQGVPMSLIFCRNCGAARMVLALETTPNLIVMDF